MTATSGNSNNNQALLATIGRVLIAIIFIISGFGKISAPEATQGYIASVGMPVPFLAYIGAILIEFGGGILLIIGYRARLVAAIMAVFTVVAALYFHHAFGDQNQMVHFLKNISMAGGLLQVVAFGAGAFSLDNRRVAGSPSAAR
jgi:putative oxidoreductase